MNALQEASAILAETYRLNAAAKREEDWAAFDERRNKFLDVVEAMPSSPEAVLIKALAFVMIHFDDFPREEAATSTDHRLMHGIEDGLMGVLH